MISYQLQQSRRSHSVRIKIDHHGQVIVSAPADCPVHFINSFVEKHQGWITTHLEKMKAKRPNSNKKEDEMLVFGKTYKKVIQLSPTAKLGVMIQGTNLLINPVSDTKPSVEKALTTFLKSTAEKYIVPRTHQLAKVMSITFNAITLRAQKTRWGSCSSQGNLNFNWKLVHTPPQVIDYVIIHELAHRREMNHSDRFWDIVRKYDPEYLKHRGWLKRNGMDLE